MPNTLSSSREVLTRAESELGVAEKAYGAAVEALTTLRNRETPVAGRLFDGARDTAAKTAHAKASAERVCDAARGRFELATAHKAELGRLDAAQAKAAAAEAALLDAFRRALEALAPLTTTVRETAATLRTAYASVPVPARVLLGHPAGVLDPVAPDAGVYALARQLATVEVGRAFSESMLRRDPDPPPSPDLVARRAAFEKATLTRRDPLDFTRSRDPEVRRQAMAQRDGR